MALVALAGLLMAGCASARPAGTSTPATSLAPQAPDFSLTDQFGQPHHLSDDRGRTLLLAFIDSWCTTLCPLTAQLMTKIQQELGPDYGLLLLAVNANPEHLSVADVRRWSVTHRMERRWLFLTGPLAALRTVWGGYGIRTKVVAGDVQHTALLFLIDGSRRIRALFPSAANAGGIDVEAQTVARTIRRLVPDPAAVPAAAGA